jgi:hypothetical protein
VREPTRDETASRLKLVRSWAREMVTGHLSPIDGARRIAGEGGSAQDELAVFHQLVREWEETGESGRPECERRMLDEASLLLADTA